MIEALPLEEFSFWTVQKGRRVLLIDDVQLDNIADFIKVEKLSESEILEIYGDLAVKRTVVLKPNTYALKGDIARLSQRKDEKLGLVHDPTLVPAARAEAVVSSWNLVNESGLAVTPTVANFQTLAGNVGAYVDAKIFAYLCPEIESDPDFLGGLEAKRQRIADKRKAQESRLTTAPPDCSNTSTGTEASSPSSAA